jgi:hypothetical protein
VPALVRRGPSFPDLPEAAVRHVRNASAVLDGADDAPPSPEMAALLEVTSSLTEGTTLLVC